MWSFTVDIGGFSSRDIHLPLLVVILRRRDELYGHTVVKATALKGFVIDQG
jgi:hypothetical protein